MKNCGMFQSKLQSTSMLNNIQASIEYSFYYTINTLILFGPYWDKGKLAQLSFYEKGERVQLFFWTQYYFRPLEIILWPRR